MRDTLLSILAIITGAGAGALLRWGAGLLLNPFPLPFPLGTLAANWAGALLMGLALGFFALHPAAAPQWKLMLITGFLGSLTTFSAFAGEMAALLRQGKAMLCAAAICLHVFGSILLVFLGLALVSLLRKSFF